MKLNRPLAVVDLETTGPDIATARIVEIAIVTERPDGSTDEWSSFVNPLMPIPAAASKVHGITDEQVASAPTFAQVAEEVMRRLDGCDLAGFNIARFDLPLLQAEFSRLGVLLPMEGRHVVDSMRIFHAFVQRDLAAAAKTYLGRELDGAHRAAVDARATLEVLRRQVVAHQLPDEVPSLAAFKPEGAVDLDGKIVWVDSEKGPLPCLSFGKHKGHSLQWLRKNEPGFLSWMLGADFPADVKAIAKAALEGRYPVKES